VSLFVNILMDGIAYGMVLFIISAGLTITLGLMRFVNLAHGAFAMLGGYVAAWLLRTQGWGLLAATLVALLVTALVAALLEVMVLRRLYRKSELQQVLFTIGLTFLFVASVNLVFGPQVQMIPLPAWLAASVDLGFRTIPAQRLLVIAVGAVVLIGVYWVMNATRFGIWLRATVDNTAAAESLGIPVQWVYAITFGAGAAHAAQGGVLGAEQMPRARGGCGWRHGKHSRVGRCCCRPGNHRNCQQVPCGGLGKPVLLRCSRAAPCMAAGRHSF
jgi:branched-chain amino acid transport system permease protein